MQGRSRWTTSRPSCPPGPAYIVPAGAHQRSDAEANRLVDWLVANGIVVHELKQPYAFDGVTYERGSYVVFMTQAHRGLADTALGIGADISADIERLYAPPAAWSHGYLWGADIVRVPREAAFTPNTNRVLGANHIRGGVEPGTATAYALVIDSPPAVRTLNQLAGGGLPAGLTTAAATSVSGATLPAGSAVFGADSATKVRLASVGRANDVWFRRLTGPAATTEPVDGRPDILVLTGAPNQDVWSLQNLGFTPDFMSVGALNSAAEDPLPGYDVVWNTGGWPSAANPVARIRLAGFFGSGGGYVGAGANGAAFLTSGSLTTGLTAATRSGDGRSAIVNWENTGGTASTVTGSAPARDTAIMDPPTWFTAVPASMAVDGRFPTDPADIVASGFWLLDEQSASAPGAAVIAHGTISQGAARATVFAMNPLYRADPEREWAMAGEALYWADQ